MAGSHQQIELWHSITLWSERAHLTEEVLFALAPAREPGLEQADQVDDDDHQHMRAQRLRQVRHHLKCVSVRRGGAHKVPLPQSKLGYDRVV